MHGRLKVKTTAEQEAEKAKEREKKMKIYQTVLKQVMEKREQSELDDDALQLTAKILTPNPDFYTLWNFRKEILLVMKQQRTKEEFQKLCLEELNFLQICLLTNPKSYSIWLHRRFIMTTMPLPDWNNELELCTKFLSYDERNFHCWDYRRFVISSTNVPLEEEFKFTTKKIFDNFSNYSAWHNRSMLLPKVHPVEGIPGAVAGVALLKEFELAQNAFFTDPYDQSAWFYHRWLLGREKNSCVLLYNSVRLINDELHAVFSFTDPVKLDDGSSCFLEVDGQPMTGIWRPSSDTQGHCCVWLFSGKVLPATRDASRRIRFSLAEHEIEKELKVNAGEEEASYDWSSTSERISFERKELPSADAAVLQAEIDSCRLLLEEEKANKWTLFTLVFLLRAQNLKVHMNEIEERLSQLIILDSYRTGFYSDLRSKLRIELLLEDQHSTKGSFADVDLRAQELTSMYYYQFLTGCRSLRLSDNNLRHLGQIDQLQNLEELHLDNNQVGSLGPLTNLPHLKKLSLRSNAIEEVTVLKPLTNLPSLETLNLEGNPIVAHPRYRSDVKETLPGLRILDGVDL